MDNEKLGSDELTVEESPGEVQSEETLPPIPSSGSPNLLWRLGVGIVAVVVIGVLLFPLFNRQTETPPAEPAPTSAQSSSDMSPIETPLAPVDATAEDHFRRGNEYYETGQLDQAVEAYQKAIELNPEYQGAYANLGVTYYQQQKFDLAASQYEKALELNPTDGEVAYNLGALYLQQALTVNGSPDADLLTKSVTQLQQALDISPDLAEPHFTLGVAYYFLEDKQKATEAFETYLSMSGGEDTLAKEEAERYLQELGRQ
ncbi:MAG: tetratricopeptide repeat protein [Anaerolineae bacterium]|nr:tetratricopeptide repeat protein [Anaerolineae bacterium]